jgi:hypothetical protein
MKTKHLKLTLIIGLLLFSFNSYSQTKTDTIQVKKVDTLAVKKDDKLKIGCGFGLNFVGGTNISISPNVIYSVSEKVAIGFGLQWNYLDLKNIQSTTSYGATTLFQFKPSQKISTLLEFAQLRVSTKSEITNTEKNYWDSALFIGAGYNITKKISIGAKYNFLYNEDESIYSSPVIPFVNISL